LVCIITKTNEGGASFMKVKAKLAGVPIELEVYKVQIALFGGPGVLIYNEDRTEEWEETNPKEVKAISKFVENQSKSFVAGYLNDEGQICLEKLLEGEWF